MKNAIIPALFVLLLIGSAAAQTTIPARSVAKHTGETVTVCEKVFDGKLIAASNITLLDLGGYNPNPQVVVIIRNADRKKFKGRPEIDYSGKDITVTGKVVMYNGKPGIVVENPKQLKVVMIDNDSTLKKNERFR